MCVNWAPKVDIKLLSLEELILYCGKQIYMQNKTTPKHQRIISGAVFIRAKVLLRIKHKGIQKLERCVVWII